MDFIRKIEAERLRLDRLALGDPRLAAKFRRSYLVALAVKVLVSIGMAWLAYSLLISL